MGNISKSVINSLIWKILERFFSQGSNLLFQIILARLLLPQDFGSLAILMAVINYATLFVQSGLATAIVQKKNLSDIDVSTLLISSLTIALVFYLILYFASPIIAEAYNMSQLILPLRVLSLILFLNAINAVQTAILYRQMRFKSLFFRSTLAVPISGMVGIVMAYMGFGLWALVSQSLVNMLLIVLMMSFLPGLRIRLFFSWTNAKLLYRFSSKILLTSLVSGLSDTIRIMAIGKRYSFNTLAYYDKAYAYSSYVSQIINASISSVLLPTFSRKQEDSEALLKMARASVKMTAFIMFPVLLFVLVAAKPLVLLLLTSKWAPSIPFLMLFCILRLPGSITSIDKQVYYAIGNSRVGLFYELILIILSILTLLITIQISIIAIAIGATVIELVGCFLIFFISSKLYNYTLKERLNDMIRPLINSSIMAGTISSVYLLDLGNLMTLLIQLPLGIIIYTLIAKITRDHNLEYIREIIYSKISSSQKQKTL